MKIIIGLFILLLLVVGVIVFSQNYLKNGGSLFFGKTTTAIINDKKINLIVAKSAKEKEIGLSEKTSLPQDQGMIFPFDKPSLDYSFWMKNMKFPIDIIFINKNKVVTLYPNAKTPESAQSPIVYKPTEPADKVLEINAGLSKKYNIKVGSEVKIENL